VIHEISGLGKPPDNVLSRHHTIEIHGLYNSNCYSNGKPFDRLPGTMPGTGRAGRLTMLRAVSGKQ